MDKNGNITISYDLWKGGIQSPFLGMADMVNVDMTSQPGVLKIDYSPTALAVSGFTNDPVVGLFEPGTDNMKFVDADGEFYRYAINTDTLAVGTDGSAGIDKGSYWKGYFIMTDNSGGTLSLNALSTGGAWTNNWDTVSGDGSYTAIHSSPADNDLYVGAGRYVARFSEVTDFDPSNGATFTKVDKFLTLPEDYVVRDIKTVANFLVVSASIIPEFIGDVPPYGARMYFWDLSQTATAAVEWSGFVDLSTSVAAPLIAFNNSIYYFDWEKLTWGVTNLSSTTDLFQFNNINDRLRGFTQCSTIIDRNVLIGLSSDETTETPAGIYKINNNTYTRNTLSNDEVGDNGDVEIHYITSAIDNKYFVGWTTGGSTFGVDFFGKNNYRYTSYKAYIESPLFNVAGAVDKRSYQQLEISLAKALTTGQGVRVSYRKNLSDSWTTIGTFDFSTYGSQSQFNTTAKITDVSTVQIKVEMTTGSNSTTTPELISVRLF